MINPETVEVDREVEAAYVRYAKGVVAETVDVWEEGTVAADVDAAGNVLGIEVLGFDDETLWHARAFAQEHDLAFPPRVRAPT